MHVDEQIQLYAALNIDILGLTITHDLGLKCPLLDLRKRTNGSPESAVPLYAEPSSSIKDVGKIEVYNVVANDEIWIVTED